MPAILGLRCPPGALQWEAGERLVDCELPPNFWLCCPIRGSLTAGERWSVSSEGEHG